MRSPADRQQRAYVAKAYHRDRGSRVRQRAAARLVRASARAEQRYTRDLVQIMRGVHAGVMALVRPEAAPRELRANREDAARSFPPPGLEPKLFEYVRKRAAPAFDRMAKVVDGENAEGLELLGIRPAMVPGLGGIIQNAKDGSLARMKKAAGDYVDDIAEVLRDPANQGLAVGELAALLEERGQVSASRARFIARDQTLSTNAAITQARQQAAGVTRYTWSTSRDERVRPMHRELEGERFAFDDPPITNEDGDTNNPGSDWGCRCVSLPLIPELEEEEPSRTEFAEEEPEAAE